MLIKSQIFMKRIIKIINLSNSKKFKTRFKLAHESEEKIFQNSFTYFGKKILYKINDSNSNIIIKN